MHQHVTHNRAYPTQKQFTEAILKFFRKTIPKQWTGFGTQVTVLSDECEPVSAGTMKLPIMPCPTDATQRERQRG